MQVAATAQRTFAEAPLPLINRENLLAGETIKVSARGLNFFYDEQQALFDNNLEIASNRVTAIIGPSGCGKSTHLRTYNRIFELYRGQRVKGEVLLDRVDGPHDAGARDHVLRTVPDESDVFEPVHCAAL